MKFSRASKSSKISAMLDDLMNCFTGLGKKSTECGPKFRCAYVRGWFNAFYSPVFLMPGSRIRSADLRRVEDSFLKNVTDGRHDWRFPYFSVFDDKSAYDISGIRKIVEEEGWTERKKATVNIWREPIRWQLPVDMSAYVGDYLLPELNRECFTLMSRNFGMSQAFVKAFNRMLCSSSASVQAVVIKNRSGRAVACGQTLTIGAYSTLYSGCVDSRYRGRGLWHTLVGMRQAISFEAGARFWVTVTMNPFIAGKSPEKVNLLTFWKESTKGAKATPGKYEKKTTHRY